MERTILHADLNSCYASIEQLHHPELRNRPVVVGGDVEARHGIVLTKSQEAKPYGIQVGMALWQARQRCPNVVIVPPNYKLYLRYSHDFRQLLSEYSNQIEPFGLDEAWADVTGSIHLFGSGEEIAEQIRQRVKDELGVTVSIGVSWNKIFAKLGSDYKKPDAITAITKENYKKIVWPLPAEDLLSVGRATRARLYKYGIYTIGDIAHADPHLLHIAGLGNGGTFSQPLQMVSIHRPYPKWVMKQSLRGSVTLPQRHAIFMMLRMQKLSITTLRKAWRHGCGSRACKGTP